MTGEILNLQRDRLSLPERSIRLKPEDTKEGRPRLVPIVPPLYEILKAVPMAIHTQSVFLYRGKPIKDIRYAFSKAVKAIGLQYGQRAENGYVFHDLRHTFITHMRKAGVPQSVIMELTGHQTRSMFDRYNKVDVDDKFEASGRYIEYLKSIPNAVKNTTINEK